MWFTCTALDGIPTESTEVAICRKDVPSEVSGAGRCADISDWGSREFKEGPQSIWRYTKPVQETMAEWKRQPAGICVCVCVFVNDRWAAFTAETGSGTPPQVVDHQQKFAKLPTLSSSQQEVASSQPVTISRLRCG